MPVDSLYSYRDAFNPYQEISPEQAWIESDIQNINQTNINPINGVAKYYEGGVSRRVYTDEEMYAAGGIGDGPSLHLEGGSQQYPTDESGKYIYQSDYFKNLISSEGFNIDLNNPSIKQAFEMQDIRISNPNLDKKEITSLWYKQALGIDAPPGAETDITWSDAGHMALDFAGMLHPAADVLNAGWYAAEASKAKEEGDLEKSKHYNWMAGISGTAALVTGVPGSTLKTIKTSTKKGVEQVGKFFQMPTNYSAIKAGKGTIDHHIFTGKGLTDLWDKQVKKYTDELWDASGKPTAVLEDRIKKRIAASGESYNDVLIDFQNYTTMLKNTNPKFAYEADYLFDKFGKAIKEDFHGYAGKVSPGGYHYTPKATGSMQFNLSSGYFSGSDAYKNMESIMGHEIDHMLSAIGKPIQSSKYRAPKQSFFKKIFGGVFSPDKPSYNQIFYYKNFKTLPTKDHYLSLPQEQQVRFRAILREMKKAGELKTGQKVTNEHVISWLKKMKEGGIENLDNQQIYNRFFKEISEETPSAVKFADILNVAWSTAPVLGVSYILSSEKKAQLGESVPAEFKIGGKFDNIIKKYKYYDGGKHKI